MMKRILLLASLMICLGAAADNSRFVNLFMGTAGDHGQVSPAAQLPFGLASVGPDCQTLTHSGYDFDDPAIRAMYPDFQRNVMRLSREYQRQRMEGRA